MVPVKGSMRFEKGSLKCPEYGEAVEGNVLKCLGVYRIANNFTNCPNGNLKQHSLTHNSMSVTTHSRLINRSNCTWHRPKSYMYLCGPNVQALQDSSIKA